MASPRLENGALHLSDAIWDALTRFRLSGREWQVLLVILLKGGSDEMQRISINQFSKATGIPSGGVHGALQGLLAKNVIIKLEETKNKGLADWWGFQEDHAEWQLKLTTATPKKAVKAKKPPPKKVIQQELFAEPKAPPKRRVGKGIKKKPTNPDIKVFIGYWFNLFNVRTGGKYHVQGGKDGQIIKALLGTYPLDDLKGYAIAFFDSTDPFIREAAKTIGVFQSVINKLAGGNSTTTMRDYD